MAAVASEWGHCHQWNDQVHLYRWFLARWSTLMLQTWFMTSWNHLPEKAGKKWP